MKIYEFLDLPEYDTGEIVSLNTGKYKTLDNSIREKLIKFFTPHNAKLSSLLNMEFNWK